jgi:serine/threonine-protein kinase
MGETSSRLSVESSLSSGRPGPEEAGRLRDPGSSSSRSSSSARSSPAAHDDQPTIITNRPPILVDSQVSDSAYRILQGTIMPGDMLGHFELVEYVGGGGMGRVFRAIDTSLARPVALKVLAPDQAADEETLLRFRNEAQSAARLDHENIARVHYVGEDHGLHYIVFEYIEGLNIRNLVEQKGPLAIPEAVGYTFQVAEALAHAAARDVVHRDIKPSNILITPDGRIKLIDMGLARLRRLSASDPDLTASGVTLGTFDYISPEQARDPRLADARSDIYSLGCTFFYMLAGRPPFPEGTVLQKLLQHQGDKPPDIREFRPELPDEASRILDKMLAKDPRNRYQQPDDLVRDLLVLAEQVGARTNRADGKAFSGTGPIASLVYRHIPWIVPLVALVAIVAVLHVFWSAPAVEQDPWETPESAQRPWVKQPPAPRVEPPAPPEAAQPSADTLPQPPAVVQPPSAGAGPATPEGGRATSPPVVPAAVATAPAPKPGAGANPAEPPAREGRADDRKGLSLEPTAGGVTAGEPVSRTVSAASAGESVAMVSGARPEPPVPPGTGPPAESAPRRDGVLIVGDADGANVHRTLAAACGAAVNGDVIELRFNGAREERPIKLANVRLTIRAGDGYEPLIAFRPNEADPIKYAHRMFTLVGGRLTLINVAVELQVPREIPADDWALFETQGGQTVRLDGCTLTIRNASDHQAAYHPEVAFFLAKTAPGADPAMRTTSGETPVVSIGLVGCIARGEADFLRCLDLQPVHLTWENGLLATSERLLLLGSGQKAPDPGHTFRLDLWHLTAAVRGGLCRMVRSKAAPCQLPLEVICADSILVGNPDAALIEQVGVENSAEFRELVSWYGDRNFYEGFAVFGGMYGPDGVPLTKPFDFEGWQRYWPENEILPAHNTVRWRRPLATDRPTHAHTPDDYALETKAGDAASGAASDGRDAGYELDSLPRLAPPAAGTPVEPSPGGSTPSGAAQAGESKPVDLAPPPAPMPMPMPIPMPVLPSKPSDGP